MGVNTIHGPPAQETPAELVCPSLGRIGAKRLPGLPAFLESAALPVFPFALAFRNWRLPISKITARTECGPLEIVVAGDPVWGSALPRRFLRDEAIPQTVAEVAV